jgi:hypothetical protein
VPKEVYVDLGYRGHCLHAIEPIISHRKNDRKISPRNWLKAILGDQINAISMAIGFNLRKILRTLFLYLLTLRIQIHQIYQPNYTTP